MANKLYWTAPGVVMIKGKEYGENDPLPVKDIDKRVLARWKKAGKIGEKIVTVAVDDRDAKILDLETKIEALNSLIKESEERKAAHIDKHKEGNK